MNIIMVTGKVRNSACVDRQVYNLSFLQKSSLVTAYLLNLLQTSVSSFLLWANFCYLQNATNGVHDPSHNGNIENLSGLVVVLSLDRAAYQ